MTNLTTFNPALRHLDMDRIAAKLRDGVDFYVSTFVNPDWAEEHADEEHYGPDYVKVRLDLALLRHVASLRQGCSDHFCPSIEAMPTECNVGLEASDWQLDVTKKTLGFILPDEDDNEEGERWVNSDEVVFHHLLEALSTPDGEYLGPHYMWCGGALLLESDSVHEFVDLVSQNEPDLVSREPQATSSASLLDIEAAAEIAGQLIDLKHCDYWFDDDEFRMAVSELRTEKLAKDSREFMRHASRLEKRIRAHEGRLEPSGYQVAKAEHGQPLLSNLGTCWALTRDLWAQTPALAMRLLELIQLARDKGAAIEARSLSNVSVLRSLLASTSANAAVVALLIDWGVNLDSTPIDGPGGLLASCESNSGPAGVAAVTEALMRRRLREEAGGAAPSAFGAEGGTPRKRMSL